MTGELRVSVVVPTLDEARRLPALLARLATMPVHEIVVVDGGSADGTTDVARAAGVRVLDAAPRGRGPQQRLGASVCDGDVLWFVHADAQPPRDAVARIREVLAEPDVVGGAFLLHTRHDGGPSQRVSLGPLLRIADLRSRWTRTPYGDQAVFCRRTAYVAVDGHPDQPLMEDLELSRRLRRQGTLVTIPEEVEVSGRRFEHAPVRAFLAMWTFPTLYRLGVPPETLAGWYGTPR